MINSISMYGRVFLTVSVVAAGIGISACSANRQQPSAAATAAVRTSAVKTVKLARLSRAAAASKSVDQVVTASTNATPLSAKSGGMSDVIVGKTWNYEYSSSRGTITYYPDGTSNYNEPGLRRGTGTWQMRGNEFCQSFSGIKEPCVILRQAGKAYHIGHIKLTLASP